MSLSPLGIETQLQNQTYRQNAWSPRTYRTGLLDEDSPTLNLASDIRNFNHQLVGSNLDPQIDRARRRNVKYPENDLNDNHDVYILPERYRQRTYSQGNNAPVNTTVPKYCQDTERTYRTIPNTYTEEERQIRYRQMQQKRLLDSQNSRHNMPEQQHTVLHQKPPLHNNYSSNYQHPPYLDNQPAYYQSDEFVNRLQNRYGTLPDEQRASQRKNSSQSQTRVSERRETVAAPLNRLSKTSLQESTRSDGQLAAGYWIRENDEIVWCPEEPSNTSNDRFGSLDRRKYNAHCGVPYNPLLQMKDRGSLEDRENYGSQHNHNVTGTRDYVLGLAGPSKFSSASAVTSHHQNYNSQVHQQQIGPSTTSCYETISPSPPPAPRTLLRTQSLGSVETWQQQQQHQQQSIVGSPDGIHPREMMSQTSSRDDTMARSRVKEKEWYETSMDSSYSASGTIPTTYEYVSDSSHRKIVQPSSPHHVRQPIGSTPPPAPPPLPSPPLPSSSSRDIVLGPLEPRSQRLYPQKNIPQQPQQPQRHPASPKSLEIPAESKRRNVHAVVDEQIINTSNNDRSPDICTIVQAGKYQPYREVTKPFEMSDFYKYSTKYRKRNETATTTNNQTSVVPLSNVEADDDDVLSRRRNETLIRDEDTSNLPLNPVQRRIYEPVQRMTCQPYSNLTRRQPMENNEDGEWRGTTIHRPSAEDSTVV